MGHRPIVGPPAQSSSLAWGHLFTNASGPRRGELRKQVSLFPVVVWALLLAVFTGALLPAESASAEGWSRVGNQNWQSERRKPMRVTASKSAPTGDGNWETLNRFEAGPKPSVARAPKANWTPPPMGAGIAGLRQLIRLAESPARGYDAIHYSAKRLPTKKPTQMTIAEILNWIAATPRQHHAIGQYQIVPSTLKRLIAKTGMRPDTMFSAEVQDYLGDVLIIEAGYREFVAGRKKLPAFMDDLARIWAGFPMGNGRSAYHGKAGNRATITRAFFEAQMTRLFVEKPATGKGA